MKTLSLGFTLIELMIVVAIIAVLAAIALPMYQSFTVRAKLSEAVIAVSPVKAIVSDAFSHSGMPRVADTADSFNALPKSEKQSKYVDNIQIDRTNGAITVTVSAKAGSDVAGKTLAYTPYIGKELLNAAGMKSAHIDWVCTSVGAQTATSRGFSGMSMGTIPAKYVAPDCR